MIANRYELPNGKVIFCLYSRKDKIKNVLLLDGRDVLFLKTVNIL